MRYFQFHYHLEIFSLVLCFLCLVSTAEIQLWERNETERNGTGRRGHLGGVAGRGVARFWVVLGGMG